MKGYYVNVKNEIYQTQSGRVPIYRINANFTEYSKEKEYAQIILIKIRLAEYGMAVNKTYPETI